MAICSYLLLALIVAIMSFGIGFLLVLILYLMGKRKQKRYQFTKPIGFDMKNTICTENLNEPQGSKIDGTNASNEFTTH